MQRWGDNWDPNACCEIHKESIKVKIKLINKGFGYKKKKILV